MHPATTCFCISRVAGGTCQGACGSHALLSSTLCSIADASVHCCCACRLVPQVLLTLVLLVRAPAFSSGPYWAMALLGSCYCHCCNYAAAARLSRARTAVSAKAHTA
jgi:hypothetical protein